ncbi:MAG: lytic transglycosylase domain-containing protein [Pseudomonadota bacterium]
MLDLRKLVSEAAKDFGLPLWLVWGVVQKESSGNPWAWNPEPHYRYLWDVRENRPFRVLAPSEIASKVPPRDFACLAGDRDQEFWAQQASWGLMQVMGAVARERGYRGPYLTELLNPEASIHYGCAHLAHLAKRFLAAHDWPGVIAAYNAGSPRKFATGRYENQAYVDRVIALGRVA